MYCFFDCLDLKKKWWRNVNNVDLKCATSKSEAERNFHLMNLICASVRSSLTVNHIFNYNILGGGKSELGCNTFVKSWLNFNSWLATNMSLAKSAKNVVLKSIGHMAFTINSIVYFIINCKLLWKFISVRFIRNLCTYIHIFFLRTGCTNRPLDKAPLYWHLQFENQAHGLYIINQNSEKSQNMGQIFT